MALVEEGVDGSMTPLQLHCYEWKDGCGAEICRRAQRVVIGKGSIPCDILFVGEAPGDSEDVTGIPFDGPAGRVLDEIIVRANLGDLKAAYANLVGCIPLGDDGNKREGGPAPEDIKCCGPRLKEFIDLARPRLIVCVGNLARDWLDQKRRPLHIKLTVPQVSITHPAAILRGGNVVSRDFAKRKCSVAIQTAIDTYLSLT